MEFQNSRKENSKSFQGWGKGEGRKEEERKSTQTEIWRMMLQLIQVRWNLDNNVVMGSKSWGRAIFISRILYSTKVYFKYEDRICSDIHELKYTTVRDTRTFSAIWQMDYPTAGVGGGEREVRGKSKEARAQRRLSQAATIQQAQSAAGVLGPPEIHSDLEFLASRTERQYCSCLGHLSLWHFILAIQAN